MRNDFFIITLISMASITIFSGCKKQNLETKTPHDRQIAIIHKKNYELKAGDKVKITGIFRTTKGNMGVVKNILIPYFANREGEALKYRNKWVKVIGKLSKQSYPENYEGQRWGGFELEFESINIIINGGIKEEKIELLTE